MCALEGYFTAKGLALPTDQAERLAARQRTRRAGTRPRTDHTSETALATVRDPAWLLAADRGKHDWTLADVHDIEAFLATLPKARKRRLAMLPQFFRFARTQKIILADPTRGLTAPRGFTGQTLTLDQRRALFRRWITDGDAHPHEALLASSPCCTAPPAVRSATRRPLTSTWAAGPSGSASARTRRRWTRPGQPPALTHHSGWCASRCARQSARGLRFNCIVLIGEAPVAAGPAGERAGAAGRGRLRASHADRDQVIDTLKAGFVQGRLTKDEFDARVGQALVSRTYGELAAASANIPAKSAVVQLPRKDERAPQPVLRAVPVIMVGTILTSVMVAAAFLTDNAAVTVAAYAALYAYLITMVIGGTQVVVTRYEGRAARLAAASAARIPPPLRLWRTSGGDSLPARSARSRGLLIAKPKRADGYPLVPWEYGRARENLSVAARRPVGVPAAAAVAPAAPATATIASAPTASAPQPQEPLWREVLGQRIRALRLRRQETLSETAGRAGLSPQYLSEIERGRKEPSSEMIAALAGALGTTLAALTEQVADDLRRQLGMAVTDKSGPVMLAFAA